MQSPKTHPLKLYTLTVAEIQAMFALPAATLASLLRKHPDALMPHLEALKTGILANYGQYESADLLKALDSEILAYRLLQAITESTPVDSPVQVAVNPSAVEFVPDYEPMSICAANQLSLIDTDTFRLAIEANQYVLARAWTFGHELARSTDNSGTIKRIAFAEDLQQRDIVRTESSFRNILERGIEAGYWRFDSVTDRIYLVSDTTLNKRFTSLCRRKNKLHLIDTNRPGNRRVYVDLHGGIAEGEARVFNAWLSLWAECNEKRHRVYQVQIAHQTLRDLWGRSRNTLKKWMQSAGVKTYAAYAESDIVAEDDYTQTRKDLVPAYAYPILTKNGQQLEAWRRPNRYSPKPVKRHSHDSKRRKVRNAVNAKFPQPADDMAGGFKRYAHTGKLNFHATWQNKKVSESVNAETGAKKRHYSQIRVEAYKNLRAHLKTHPDAKTHSHYVLIGKRRFGRKSSVYIYEASTGNLYRGAKDRDFATERSPEFRAKRALYRAYRMDVHNA